MFYHWFATWVNSLFGGKLAENDRKSLLTTQRNKYTVDWRGVVDFTNTDQMNDQTISIQLNPGKFVRNFRVVIQEYLVNISRKDIPIILVEIVRF
jgi:hypothetical protein